MIAWTQRRLQATIMIGDQSLSCLADSVDTGPVEPAGGLVPSAAGRTSYQVRAGTERPLSTRQEISLDLIVTSEEDYFLLRGMLGLASIAPLRLWMDWPEVESWIIATGRTEWPTLRAMPYDLVSIATYAPRLFIGSTEQALVASSPPGAGEFYVDPSASSMLVETPDISADAGQVLTLRYHPIRYLGLVEMTANATDEDAGLWSVSITAEEHVA